MKPLQQLDTATEATPEPHAGSELSFAQQRLWFVDQLQPGSSVYNIPLVLDFEGPLEVPVLERCLTELCRRHESLRTVFPVVEGQPRQRVEPLHHIRLETEDLSQSPVVSSEAAADAQIDEIVNEPFDLSRGPLLRARLLELSATRYVMVGAIHHIVSDKWSSGIFMRELGALYEAFLEERPSPLEKLSTSYAECARRERARLQGEALEQELAYWRQQLASPRSELELPLDHSRPLVASYRGDRESIKLSATLLARLERLSRDERATLYMVLLATFGVLLRRYTGQDDLIVGSPIANRTTSETEELIGLFVNTLALRLDVSGEPTFREFLRRVRSVALGAYEHQSLPFEKLIEELKPERSLGRSPIFQTLLNFHNVPGGGLSGVSVGSLRIRRRPVSTQTAKFDLTLTLRREPDGLDLSAEYATDLFEAPTVRRLLGHYEQLLLSVTEDPDQPVWKLSMLTQTEQKALLASAENTRTAECDSLVHALIEQQARSAPDAIAVETTEGRLTYAELDAGSNRLARYLMTEGVGKGDLVGVCLPRTGQMVVAVLGVLKAGAAYVPLDPAFPKKRLEFMANDAGLKVVVSHSDVMDRLDGCRARTILLDTEWSSIQAEDESGVDSELSPHDLAYVMYTSGSTGDPKGVRVTHLSIANFLASMRQTPGMTAADVMVAVTTLSFDISVLEIFLPLLVGAKVYVVDAETSSDGSKLASAIEASGATVMQATPATWQMLFDAGWQGTSRLRALCGGEALPRPLAERLVACVSKLWNMYGPTETTVWSTCGEVSGPDAEITVGRPISNTSIYVLDEHFQVVPIGVEGEVYIGGSGVADGYLERRALTDDRFVPDSFHGDGSRRMYRTGDLGRWRADGRLEIAGRVDRQVKVRGFRIEPGEVEAALLQHPGVKGCVVEPSRAGADVRLAAYLVYDDCEALTASEVRQFLRNTLPAYMVPGLVMELPSIPLTPNGKVDRLALPDPFGSRDNRPDRSPPSSSSEKLVAEVWRDLLGIDEVGREDNFFELGGHSLLSIRAVSAIERETGQRIDPRTMFFQTLKEIAAALSCPTAHA